MGCSVAAALRRRGLVQSVVGYDPDADALRRAVAARLIDQAAGSAGQAAAGADLVVLAAPVGAMPQLLQQIAPRLEAGALVTDLGSTKADVVAAARLALGAHFSRFVGAHPIAGGERTGPEGADAHLFEGRMVVITPVEETSAEALTRIEALWRACGAHIERMSCAEHDHLLASVSHLPHMLAFALVGRIAQQPDADRRMELAGPGFRDFSRIAASNPRIWTDIALANGGALGRELREFSDTLRQIADAIERGDGAWLHQFFERASRARRRMNGHPDAG